MSQCFCVTDGNMNWVNYHAEHNVHSNFLWGSFVLWKKKEKEEAPSAFQSCSGFSLVKYINILSLNNTRMIVVVVYCISVMENELHALLWLNWRWDLIKHDWPGWRLSPEQMEAADQLDEGRVAWHIHFRQWRYMPFLIHIFWATNRA